MMDSNQTSSALVYSQSIDMNRTGSSITDVINNSSNSNNSNSNSNETKRNTQSNKSLSDDRVHILHKPPRIKSTSNHQSIRWKDDIEQNQPIQMGESPSPFPHDPMSTRRDVPKRPNNTTKSYDTTKRRVIHPLIQPTIIDALERRAFHLPGNTTWWEDWRQYIANTHPLWALCCSHELHPGGLFQRTIVFFSSIMFGLSISIVALLWSKQEDSSLTEDVIQVAIASPSGEETFEEIHIIKFSYIMLYLVTWMSCLHAVHDLGIWYLFCDTLGVYTLWLIVWIGTSIALFSMLVSSHSDLNNDGEEDDIQFVMMEILLYTIVEILMSWAVWYLVVATVLFSGMLGCFKVPCLGGRRQELTAIARRRRRKDRAPVGTMNDFAIYDT